MAKSSTVWGSSTKFGTTFSLGISKSVINMKFFLAFLATYTAFFGASNDELPAQPPVEQTKPEHPLNDLYCDFIFRNEPAVLEHPLPNGKWRVSIVMGDETLNHNEMQVKAEGEPVGPPCSSMIGQYVYVSQFGATSTPAHFDVDVADGSLTLEISPSSGEGYHEWVLNQMTIERISPFDPDEESPIKEYKYDFGVAESGLQEGYTRIGEATWSILERTVERGQARKRSCSLPHIGIDEKSFKKGQNYNHADLRS